MANYNKRPIWQWVLIYGVVGGALYGAIYLFLIKGSYGQTMPNNPNQVKSYQSPLSY